jgi:hypothetical protein
MKKMMIQEPVGSTLRACPGATSGTLPAAVELMSCETSFAPLAVARQERRGCVSEETSHVQWYDNNRP